MHERFRDEESDDPDLPHLEPGERFVEKVESDGKAYLKIDTGYTIRQWYAHSTEEKGPGPGWDFREGLLDKEWAMKKFGRTFSLDEVYGKEALPDDPYYRYEAVRE